MHHEGCTCKPEGYKKVIPTSLHKPVPMESSGVVARAGHNIAHEGVMGECLKQNKKLAPEIHVNVETEEHPAL